ncbi:MAG: DUF1610 domain-containing protein [Nanoarchaeota archaeon]|nr:DUF1610 domain-containing protein [Nanoarchaeota archaeon]
MDTKINYDTATGVALTNDIGATSFPCPQCGKATIFRSRNSREICVKYTCPECGFVGPN